jgi:hypothetical protein
MKKIKILRYAIIVFMVLMSIGLLEIAFFYVFNYQDSVSFIESQHFGKLTFYVGSFLSVLFIIGLFYTQKMLGLFSKNLCFDSKSIAVIKKAGVIFIVFSVLSMLKNIFESFPPVWSQLLDYLLNFTFLLVGFGMLSFADVLKRGNKIQEENELTI